MPIVTVCLPTYESTPAHLHAALDSVLAQTFTDWELIIHDDASHADVQSMLSKYSTDSRITYYKSPVRLGIGGNWNACARVARGELISYLFQDDLWHPQYLQRSVDILNQNADIGFTAANHSYLMEGHTSAAATGIYDEVTDARSQMKEGRLSHEEFLQSWIERGLRPNLIGEPSFVTLRHELLKRVGPFREDMKQGLDSDYWVRCLLHSDGFWIAENLGQFRVHPKAATARNEESGAGSLDRLRIFRSLSKALPPGPMKKLTKRVMRREIVGMFKKFVSRRLRLS